MVKRRKESAVIRPFEEVSPLTPGEGLPGSGIGGPVDDPDWINPNATKAELRDLLAGARGILRRTQASLRSQVEELQKSRQQVRDEISARSETEKALKEKHRLLEMYETTINVHAILLAAKPKAQEFRLKMEWGASGSPQSFNAQIEEPGNEDPL